MALAAVGVPQHGRGTLLTGQGRGLRLDHRHRIALNPFGSLGAFSPLRTIIPVIAVPTGTLVAGPIIAGSVVTRAIIARTLVPRAFISRSIVSGTIIAGPFVPGSVIPGTVIAIAVFPRRTFVTGAIIPGLIIPRTVIPLTPAIAARRIIVVVEVAVAIAIVPVIAVAPAIAIAGLGLGLFLAFGLGFCRIGCGGGLGTALVFEVDVEAGGKRIAAQDFRGGTLGLHGPNDPEIVFCVLQVVLSQNPVTCGCRIPGQLLVFFEDVLGVAADLDAVRTIGLKSPVGVLRLRFAATTAAAIAAALTLHTLEISHSLLTVPPALHLSGNARA
jgi:hypothetical protein